MIRIPSSLAFFYIPIKNTHISPSFHLFLYRFHRHPIPHNTSTSCFIIITTTRCKRKTTKGGEQRQRQVIDFFKHIFIKVCAYRPFGFSNFNSWFEFIITYEKRRRSLFLAYLKDTGLRIAYPTEISNAASLRPCTYKIQPIATGTNIHTPTAYACMDIQA